MSFPDRDLGGEAAEQRVELQEVLERLRVVPVADGGDADVKKLPLSLLKDHTGFIIFSEFKCLYSFG
jgi:hypothetical protein